MKEEFSELKKIRQTVENAVNDAPVFDLHTHLFAPEFGALNLWGIDELLNYHYLIAEFFRFSDVSTEDFFALETEKRADLIWQKLFVENSPISEATRGVISILDAFGLNTKAENLTESREFFKSKNADEHISEILKIAKVSDVVMTNDPLDEAEISVWNSAEKIDARFHAALRLDRILNNFEQSVPLLKKQNYDVNENLNAKTFSEIRRFLEDWIEKMKPLYLGVSLSDDFIFPDENSSRGRILKEAVLPVCREKNIALALMIGVRRGVNPALKLAGDGLGAADVRAVTNICAENPDIRFLVTFLSRENQHELCVAARKFGNLMPFGCWWFLNNPSIIEEITRERFELLGTSFIPQHSDARVFDQLIYKWKHSRRIISNVLISSYKNLLEAGRSVEKSEIERDVKKLFSENFKNFVRF